MPANAPTDTRHALIEEAIRLETMADTLYYSLLAHSMTERTMREEAAALRKQARGD